MRTLIQVAIPEEPQTLRGLHRRRRPRQRAVQDEADDLAGGRPRLLRLVGHRSAGPRPDQLLPLRGHVQDVHRDLPDHGQRSPDPLQRRLLSRCSTSSCRRGACCDPRFPAALGCRTHALARLFDVLGGALCKQAPELNTAAGYGTSPYMLYSGWDEKGEFFYSMEILYGGIPGRPIGDGMDGHSWWPLFENIPTEYLEAYYPLRIDGYTTVTDSGGAGLHRGGNGVEKRYVYLEPGEISIHDDRWLTRPWGVLGGWPGGRSAKLLRRADGTEEILPSKCDQIEVEPGDMLVYRTAGGGGWKDRLDRPAEAVARDVSFGLVSRARWRRTATASCSATTARSTRPRPRRSARASARSAATRSRSTSGRRSRRLLARCEEETGLEPPMPATPLRWSPLEPGDEALARVRAGDGIPARSRRSAGLRPEVRHAIEGFHGRAGLGRRPALLVDRRQRRLHRPGLAARLRPRRTWSRRSGACSASSGERRCRSSSRPSRSTRRQGRRPRVFIDKVPALLTLEAGSRWVEIDPRLAPQPERAGADQALRVGVLRHAARRASSPRAAATRVIVTGASTSGCVRATAVDALQHGYRVVVPREAVGDRNPAAHEANLYDIDAKYGTSSRSTRSLAHLEEPDRIRPAHEEVGAMLVRDRGDGWQLVRQPDHADLSGAVRRGVGSEAPRRARGLARARRRPATTTAGPSSTGAAPGTRSGNARATSSTSRSGRTSPSTAPASPRSRDEDAVRRAAGLDARRRASTRQRYGTQPSLGLARASRSTRTRSRRSSASRRRARPAASSGSPTTSAGRTTSSCRSTTGSRSLLPARRARADAEADALAPPVDYAGTRSSCGSSRSARGGSGSTRTRSPRARPASRSFARCCPKGALEGNDDFRRAYFESRRRRARRHHRGTRGGRDGQGRRRSTASSSGTGSPARASRSCRSTAPASATSTSTR